MGTLNHESSGKKFFVSNRDESVPVFRNAVLEYFSHIHPLTPFVVYVPVVLYFFVIGARMNGGAAAMLFFLLGLLFWTLLEYFLHRFVFHFVPRSDFGRRIAFLIHGIHHDYPRDSSRLVMPLLVSVPLALFFYSLLRGVFLFGYPAVFAGLVAGYLAYDGIHFAVHHFALKGRIGSYLKRYHFRHHFQDEGRGFGVSNPLWDLVFRTAPAEEPRID